MLLYSISELFLPQNFIFMEHIARVYFTAAMDIDSIACSTQGPMTDGITLGNFILGLQAPSDLVGLLPGNWAIHKFNNHGVHTLRC